MDRRSFLTGMLAAGAIASGGVPAFAASSRRGTPRLRIGVLSDTHLEDEDGVGKFEKALAHFRDLRVDGVLICGDLTDHGILPELKRLASSWEKVFPNSQLPDGSRVERLFHYGDHDTGGYAHKREFFGSGDKLMERYGVSYEELCSWVIRPKPAEAWEEAFGEKWEPIARKTVKGYDFVLAHFTLENSSNGNSTPGLEEFYETFKPDPYKVFFHSQHRVYRRTAGGPAAWGQDDGTAGAVLSRFPNCVAFCGHGHLTATDERTLWQGAFSAIEVPSLRYVDFPGDHENADVSFLRKKAGILAQMDKLSTSEAQQGMVMEVYDREIVIQRLDFGADAPLGSDWVIPLDPKRRPCADYARRRALSTPQFPKGSSVRVDVPKGADGAAGRQIVVEFPLAQPTRLTPRAFDYAVTAIGIEFGGVAAPVTHRVYSPRAFDASVRDPGPGRCVFSLDEFPSYVRNFYVEVVPCDPLGGCGKSIFTEFKL